MLNHVGKKGPKHMDKLVRVPTHIKTWQNVNVLYNSWDCGLLLYALDTVFRITIQNTYDVSGVKWYFRHIVIAPESHSA